MICRFPRGVTASPILPGPRSRGAKAPRGFGVRVTAGGNRAFMLNYRLPGQGIPLHDWRMAGLVGAQGRSSSPRPAPAD